MMKIQTPEFYCLSTHPFWDFAFLAFDKTTWIWYRISTDYNRKIYILTFYENWDKKYSKFI